MTSKSPPRTISKAQTPGKLDARSLTGFESSTTDDFSSSDFSFLLTCFSKLSSMISRAEMKLGQWLFPHMPGHYSLRKKLLVTKPVTEAWAIYDFVQILLIILYMSLYICFMYQHFLSYSTLQNLYRVDLAVASVFILDHLLFFYMDPSVSHFWDGYTMVGIASVVPSFVGLANGIGNTLVSLNFLRCVRIIMIIRISGSMKYMHSLSGLRRQVIYLTLTLSIMIVLATAIVHLTENLESECTYINAATGWMPSCTEDAPATDECSCDANDCKPYYSQWDAYGEPYRLICSKLSILDALYYIIVTVATIGYGDVRVTSTYARIACVVFITISVVLIPMRLSELQNLLSLTSPYTKPYVPQNNEGHVIITGYTSDKRKLNNFLSEFFHPDRTSQEGEEYHAVILSEIPPSEDIRSLLLDHSLESKVTWVLGSPHSIASLKKVQAMSAIAMFFLIDNDLMEGKTKAEDAANLLSALSVSNYNSNITSFVQVVRPENGDILQDSDVDMILCMDEFKTAVQARNAICPGFTTFIENIFHSMGALDSETEKSMAPWYDEYLHGAGMEIYYVPLTQAFIRRMRYSFARVSDLLFVEWGCIALGLCSEKRDNVYFNPNASDLEEFANVKEFFQKLDTLIIIADDQHIAAEIAQSLASAGRVEEYVEKAVDEEARFPCGSRHRLNKKTKPIVSTALQNGFVSAKATPLHHPIKKDLTLSPSSIAASPDLLTGPISAKSLMEEEFEEDSEDSEENDQTTSSRVNYSNDNDSEESFSENENEDSDDDLDPENYIGFNHKGLSSRETFSISKRATLDSKYKEETRRMSNEESDDAASTEGDHEKEEYTDVGFTDNMDGFDSDTDTDSEDSDVMADDDFGIRMGLLRAREEVTFGRPSAIIKDVNNLSKHIIVHGDDSNLIVFVEELRRPAVKGDIYHPVVIVSERVPKNWGLIAESFNDVYLLLGKITSGTVLKKLNLKFAYSMSLMAHRSSMTHVDEISINTGTLFTFLKLERFMPKNLQATVELTSSSNIGVLNATIMRRFRDTVEKEVSAGRITNVLGNQGEEELDGSERDTSPTPMRRLAITDANGRFATKRNTKAVFSGRQSFVHTMQVQKIAERVTPPPGKGRRASTLGLVANAVVSVVEDVNNNMGTILDAFEDESSWDAMDSHFVLPVFASAKAYVPSSFESLLVQSFYEKLAPILCDTFVCGQKSQSMRSIKVPSTLSGRKFIDTFRLLCSNNILCVAVYRAPQQKLGSTLPYVFTSPKPESVLSEKDHLMVFSNSSSIARFRIAARMVR